MPLLADTKGNLVANGDLADVVMVTDRSPNNAAEPPYPFPLGWQYNCWGGGPYRFQATPDADGGWSFGAVYGGPAAGSAGAVCVLRYHHPTFVPRPTRTYELSYRIRTTGPTSVGVWGRTRSGTTWRESLSPIAADPVNWQTGTRRFRPSAQIWTLDPGGCGFYLDFTLQGGGEIRLAQVELREM